MSQAFFDVNHFTEMAEHLRQQGITTPVVPGILPIKSWSWAKNFVEKFCPTTTLPDACGPCWSRSTAIRSPAARPA